MEKIICIGAANTDRKAYCDRLEYGTSNSVHYFNSFGGVARNVAEDLSRLKVPVSLLTFTGDDREGQKLLDHCRKNNIDTSMSYILSGQNSGTYTAILDKEGELQFGLADMQLYDNLQWEMIENYWPRIQKSEFIFTETNLPKDILAKLIKKGKKSGLKVIVDAVTVEKSMKLSGNLDGIFLLKLNRPEAEKVTGLSNSEDFAIGAKKLRDAGVENVLITLGPDGVYFCGPDGEGQVKAIRTNVVDVTGAGDAFNSGIIYGLLKGNKLSEAVRYGVKAASITVNSAFSVSEELNIDNIEKLQE